MRPRLFIAAIFLSGAPTVADEGGVSFWLPGQFGSLAAAPTEPDAHLDFAASHFVSPTCHVGVAGYAYVQLSGDSGEGAALGDFKSQVMGFGPQAGWFIGERKWYLNLKGYYEYNARNRPRGWNAWLTVAIPLTESKS